MPKLRVLIVDDAVVVRRILTDALAGDPDIEVASAANGRIALAKLEQYQPDLVTLDMEMPELDGLGTLKALRKSHPKLPVIMFSTLTERGAAATLDALAAGANDYLTKPANVGSVGAAIARIKGELIPKIKALCAARLQPAGTPTPTTARPAGVVQTAPPPPVFVPSGPVVAGPVDVVAIGVSTGGPNALSEMLPGLPALPVPVVIVQHMPPIFTKLLADRLAAQCKRAVREGAAGMPLRPGEIVIAPGGAHMTIDRGTSGPCIGVNQDPPENSCRPAVDVLFRSVVARYGSRVLAVIMTGMGSDGLKGCEVVRQAGGQVIVQDEQSSVVWGMPGFVAKAGLAHRQLPLTQIAGEIARRVSAGGGGAAMAKAG